MISIVLICLVIQIIFYGFLFHKLAGFNEEKEIVNQQKLSIVICYKNESENIDKYLPQILNQEFDELILMDDHSQDTTLQKLKKYQSDNVKVISVKSNRSGKKQAVFEGIKAATYNSILLTDADCFPKSNSWSKRMNSYNTSFVLGYGPMNKTKGWINLFARYETYMTALQYLSYALNGNPYMGVGRNLLVDKQLVLENHTALKGKHLASGDDDLMINLLANSNNTSVCLDPESFVYSQSKQTLFSFLRQKSRHISTSPYYRMNHKIMLMLFSSSHILFYFLLIFGTIAGTISMKFGLILLVIKWTIQQSTNFYVMRKLKEEDLFWKFPILDVLFFFYLLIMPFYYLFNKNNSNWN